MSIQIFDKLPNFHVIVHPIIQYKLALLRDVTTNRKLFKELTEEIAMLIVYEAMRDLPTVNRSITTPLETFEGTDLKSSHFLITPILRAGLGMADGILKLLPMARVGHIGFYRDEKTLEAKNYYFKLPPDEQMAYCFVCDPMLATGGTACATIDKLKAYGLKKINFICLVAAPEGVKKLIAAHPDVAIFAASLDRQLNEKGYILPGLGDAGDRIWAVK